MWHVQNKILRKNKISALEGEDQLRPFFFNYHSLQPYSEIEESTICFLFIFCFIYGFCTSPQYVTLLEVKNCFNKIGGEVQA